MYDLDHLNERTSAVKALFRALPYVAYTQTSISDRGLKVVVFSRCPHPGRVSSRLRHLPADTGTHRRASVRRTMRPHHPALFLRMGCRRLLQSHSRTLSVEEELDTDPSLTNLIKDKRNLPGSNGNPYATSNGSPSLPLPKPADTSKPSPVTSPITTPGRKATATSLC